MMLGVPVEFLWVKPPWSAVLLSQRPVVVAAVAVAVEQPMVLEPLRRRLPEGVGRFLVRQEVKKLSVIDLKVEW
jgi:hypothetical protein